MPKMIQLDLMRRGWVVCSASPPDGSGHLYDADSEQDALRQHRSRMMSGRFPWLQEPVSVLPGD